MAFSRKFLTDHGVPEEQVDAIMAERNRTLNDYVPKTDVEAQIAEALKKAPPASVTDSKEYKDLESQFTDFKARTEARNSDAWKGVKAKFFDTVYDHVDRTNDITEQLAAMRKDYEEYFMPTDEKPPVTPPVFSQTPGRTQTNPVSTEDSESEKFVDALLQGITGVKKKG